jgi:two-component system NtrC family response regulator
MVVDDEEDFLFTMGYWLKSKGYKVLTASNGAKAVETIGKEPVDIVFLDIHMPVMDGFETLRNIRKLNKDIPVVIITAYTSDERMSEIGKDEISGFFSKDRDFSESEVLIESILRRHKSLQTDKKKQEN